MARKRRTSRLGVERGERYALIPEEVMMAPAYHAQPEFARSVLCALACRCNGHNNGELSLPFSEAKRLGIAARWKLYAGLRLLELGDLIVCTRHGKLSRGTKLPSLYALTWRAINPSPQLDPTAAPSVRPSHAWAKWTKPDDWRKTVRRITHANQGRKKNPESHRVGSGRSHRVGPRRAPVDPTVLDREGQFLDPTVLDTSKTQGRGAGFRSDRVVKLTPKARK